MNLKYTSKLLLIIFFYSGNLIKFVHASEIPEILVVKDLPTENEKNSVNPRQVIPAHQEIKSWRPYECLKQANKSYNKEIYKKADEIIIEVLLKVEKLLKRDLKYFPDVKPIRISEAKPESQ